MQCRDVRELADSFIAGELQTETNHDVLRHLAGCPECRREIDARRALKATLRRAVLEDAELAPAPDFLTRLATALEAEHTGTGRRWSRTGAWWAVAAAAVLVIAAGVVGLHRASRLDLARAAAGDHRNCALHFNLAETPIPLEQAARRYGPMYRILQQLPPADVQTTAARAHVVARHSCVYGGRRFAHVVLEYRGAIISLLVTRRSGVARLPLPGEVPGSADGLPILSSDTADHVVFLTGSTSQEDLRTLAEAVSAPLATALSEA